LEFSRFAARFLNVLRAALDICFLTLLIRLIFGLVFALLFATA